MQSPPPHADRLERPKLARHFVGNAFLFIAVVVIPSALPPEVWGGRAEALSLTPTFRAILLGTILILGLLAYTLVSTARLTDIRKQQFAVRPWVLFLGLLVVWLIVSTASTSLSPWGSTLGNPDRMDGALIQAGWFSLVFVALAVVRATRLGEGAVARWLVVSALVTSVWVFMQVTGLGPLEAVAGVYLTIPAGAFGHGSFASMFLAFAALVLGSIWSSVPKVGWPRYVAFFPLGLGLASAGGRAALIGLLLGGVCLVIGRVRERLALRRILTFGAFLGLGILAAIAFVERAQTQAENLAAAVSGNDLSVTARLASWNGGARLLAAYPVLGVGAGGFEYGVWSRLSAAEAAVMIRDPLGPRVEGLPLDKESYTISNGVIAIVDNSGRLLVTRLGWDKAHNYLLDLGLTAGVPAVILFIAFVVAAFLTLWRGTSALSKGTACALVAFAVYGQAWFGNISLDPVVWVLVGSGLAFARPRNTAAEPLDSSVTEVLPGPA